MVLTCNVSHLMINTFNRNHKYSMYCTVSLYIHIYIYMCICIHMYIYMYTCTLASAGIEPERGECGAVLAAGEPRRSQHVGGRGRNVHRQSIGDQS